MSALGEQAARPALYWEDFLPGQSFALGEWRLSAEEIIGFAKVYDPQVAHVDPEAAKTTFLGGLAASGWHSCGLLMRLLHDGLLSGSAYLGMPRIDAIRWQAPLRPGQTVTGRAKCLEKRPIADRPGWGVCEFQVEAADGAGRSVAWWRSHLVFARRPRRGLEEDGAAMPWPAFLEAGRRALPSRAGGAHMLKFFDEIQPGDAIAIGSYAFTAWEIAAFAEAFDPKPQPLGFAMPADATSCAASSGSGCASIWHIAAAWMRCIADYYHAESARLGAMGRAIPRLGPSPGVLHARWHSPVRAGEVITFRSWAERKLDLPGRAGWGLLLAGAEGVNEKGETCVSFFPQLLLERDRRAVPVMAGEACDRQSLLLGG
jgi:acyl dehydratase